MPRRATIHNKRDLSEKPILQALSQMGISSYEGAPLDFWSWIAPLGWVAIECKTGNAPLTPGQQDFIRDCQRSGRPYLVLRSVDAAIDSVNALRKSQR